jgi:hypothetical protein
LRTHRGSSLARESSRRARLTGLAGGANRRRHLDASYRGGRGNPDCIVTAATC